MKICWTLLLFWFAPYCLAALKSDEQLQFFSTDAYMKQDETTRWVLPIHGWVYEPERASFWRKAMISGLGSLLGLSTQALKSNPYFRERIRLFLVDNERGKRFSVTLGSNQYRLQRSEAGGHLWGRLVVKQKILAPLAKDGWVTYQVVTRSDDARTFEGAVQLLAAKGVSVISDIDDTIKHSQVTDHHELLRNTFLRPFRPVPGMAPLYQHWANQGVRFHYISSSPWQLYPFLTQFIEQQGFPAGSFQLRRVRLTDSSALRFLDLTGKGISKQYKINHIQALLERYPERRFLLVGDSGELDPEIYAEIARRFPKQIQAILIRLVEGANNQPKRFDALFHTLPKSLWTLFSEPATLQHWIKD